MHPAHRAGRLPLLARMTRRRQALSTSRSATSRTLGDRLTAATSPLAAFAGLSVGLLVVKMTRQRTNSHARQPRTNAALVLAPYPANSGQAASPTVPAPVVIRATVPDDRP